MQELTLLYKTWKLLLASGVLGLLISSLLILGTINHFGPLLQSRRKQQLRDQKSESISRFGGVGIAGSFFIALALIWWLPAEAENLDPKFLSNHRLLGMCLGGILAWCLGFVDDIIQLKARWKLMGQLAVAFLAFYSGFNLDRLQEPFFQIIDMGFWSLPMTLLWIVGVMNAINLIDGLDGLAGGILLSALSCLGIICWWSEQLELLLLILILLGSIFGFWLFNKPPASIYMGDSGSLFLGYIVALISMWATETSRNIQSMLPVLILAVPMIDTGLAFYRRSLKGIPFYSADHDHLHHRLLARGYSHGKAMVILVGFSILFCMMALIARYDSNLQGFSFLGGILLGFFLLYYLEYETVRKPLSSIINKNNTQQRRDLMIALANQMDDFLAKDSDQQSVFHSFNYWVNLAGISRYKILKKGSVYRDNGTFEDSLRIVIFKNGDWEIQLGLPQSSWTIDSDVKSELMEKASNALINRLEKSENNKIPSLD